MKQNSSITDALPDVERVHSRKASQVVADAIRSAIIRGKLKTGDTLPAEQIMIEKYSVSRPTLREGIRILESEGLIEVTRGSRGGAVVQSPGNALVARAAGIALQSQGATLGDIYELRTIIEPPAARRIAEKNKEKAVPILRKHLEREFELADEIEAVHREIAKFHKIIVELADLPPLTMVAHSLQEIVEKHMEIARSGNAPLEFDTREAMTRFGLRSHGKLINLIEAGDGAGAQAHWDNHMKAAGVYWLQEVAPTTILELLR